MVDFEKLRSKKSKPKPVDPVEIFRRLPKPPGVNDLYTSQGKVLQEWYKLRNQRDAVVKLHTGGGKTLVGLLMAQSSINETKEPALYLTPTVQLVKQTIEKAQAFGIAAVPYENRQTLNDDFVNGNAMMVATYKALFNGQSKFGLRGEGPPVSVGTIILDDAHAAFSVIRDSFTLSVDAKESRKRYENLTGLFRSAFDKIDRIGTFDDTVSGAEFGVIEVPYWAWHEKLKAVREQLKADADEYPFVWPLLRDRLHLCHALISRHSFSITPVLPMVDAFPTFIDAKRRIYMSATIADDSEIVRTFDADPDFVAKSLTSRSLAGVSERMILIPDLMPLGGKSAKVINSLLKWTTESNLGAIILVNSDKVAQTWGHVATVVTGSKEVEQAVLDLQTGKSVGPFVFANRYDGIDLPGDSCRLLVMFGLPKGTSDYELYRASALYGGGSVARMLAQRIEQGIGRGARGAGDYCVVLLAGADLTGWISHDANFRFLTDATKAQLEMGTEISKAISGARDLKQTIERSYARDASWTEYHAETLAELTDDDSEAATVHLGVAAAERKAFELWSDGYFEKAITRLEKLLKVKSPKTPAIDPQTLGWLQQLAARIADNWGHPERSEDLQREAFANNRNLLRPKVMPPYTPLITPGPQAKSIADQLGGYRQRRGILLAFDEVVSHLTHDASSNNFEESLAKFFQMIGLTSERFDDSGEGPDLLVLMPNKTGLVIEAKSRKKEKNSLTKDDHGQLLVAAEWFAKKYPDYKCVRVSVLPANRATKAAAAEGSFALTYEKLAELVSDARAFLSNLCESQLSADGLIAQCNALLSQSPLAAGKLVATYFVPFRNGS